MTYSQTNPFAKLQDDCKEKKLEAVVIIHHGKLIIEIKNGDGKTLENIQVQQKEKIEDAASRLHSKMKKGNIL